MNQLNRVLFEGNLTREPETKDFNGRKLTKFTLANNKGIQKDGEWVNKATFITFEGWGDSVEKILAKSKVGQTVRVEGHMGTDSWIDKETGENRSATKFISDSVTLYPMQKKSVENEKNAAEHAEDAEMCF